MGKCLLRIGRFFRRKMTCVGLEIAAMGGCCRRLRAAQRAIGNQQSQYSERNHCCQGQQEAVGHPPGLHRRGRGRQIRLYALPQIVGGHRFVVVERSSEVLLQRVLFIVLFHGVLFDKAFFEQAAQMRLRPKQLRFRRAHGDAHNLGNLRMGIAFQHVQVKHGAKTGR